MNGYCREPRNPSKNRKFVPKKLELFALGVRDCAPRIVTERPD
jgi:hypothetical protein